MKRNLKCKDLWKIYSSINVSDFKPYQDIGSDDWFKYYKLKSKDDINKWIFYTNTKFPPALYKNKVVVDMGCGWGLFSILAYFQGASKVLAVGPDRRVDFLRKTVKQNGIGDGIKCIKQYFDIDSKKIVDKKIDIIIGNEFIEHLTSRQRLNFFRVAWGNLQDDGALLLHTHNTDNIRVLKGIQIHWEKQENNIYIKMIENIILKQFKEIGIDNITALAKATYGLNKREVIRACQNYSKYGKLPQKAQNRYAINPESGIPDENYISPQIVKKEMVIDSWF